MMNVTMKSGLAALAATLLLSACGNSGGGVSGGEHRRLVQACTAGSGNNNQVCTCVADRARDTLTSGSFDMLLASAEGDDARSAELRSQLSAEEIDQSRVFMQNAFGVCGGS
jgi:hypothetical protein